MNSDFFGHLESIINRMEELARTDRTFRGHLRVVVEQGRRLVNTLDEEDNRKRAEADRAAKPAPGVAEALAALKDKLHDNTLGNVSIPLPKDEPEQPLERAAVRDNELALIEKRCLLKAEAVRWMVETAGAPSAGEAGGPMEKARHDFIERAKGVPDCFLWMINVRLSSPDTAAPWRRLAEAYANLAAAAALFQRMLPELAEQPAFLESAVKLVAEAQSAVRVAAAEVKDGDADTDQERCFRWLRRVTSEERIFIERFMRRTDSASPHEWEELRARIRETGEAFGREMNLDKQSSILLNKARYHVKKIMRHPNGDSEYDWQTIMEVVEKVLTQGFAPSNVILRDLLLPVIDDLPENDTDSPGFALVLREIDRYLSTAPVSSSASLEQKPSREADKVKSVLGGKSAVFIGGNPRPGAHQAMQKAFGLSELIWVDSRAHQSIEPFQPVIARPDVALVLLAIRWSSHSFGDIKKFCDDANKPLVRLPGGYGINQVAKQILDQASGALSPPE